MPANMFLSLLLVSSSPQILQAINPDTIKLNVTASSKGLLVSWQNPIPNSDSRCYESQLQHNISCHADWQTVALRDWFFLVDSPSRGRSYTFRVRMRHISGCPGSQRWSAWSTPIHWVPENHTEVSASCDTEAKIQIDGSTYISTVIPLSLCFLLVCICSQTRIRMIFLPHIPSPKHACGSLLASSPSQWRAGFFEPVADCETVDVEIVSIQNTVEEAKEKEEGEKVEKKKEEEVNGNEECSVFDQGVYPSNAGFKIYPSLVANEAYYSLCHWGEHNVNMS